ncbi:MAG: hypothetical protein HKN56_08425 [Gammaproteobacteria bacterium]|nr:hypothetical protein [Gammaproteobacteria bacterium]
MSTLDDIIDLTVRVEDCVDAGDWTEAAALDVQRVEVIGRYLNEVADGPGQAAAAHMLRELLARNELAMRKVQVMRELILEKSSELKASDKAVKAYVQHASDNPAALGG